MADAEKPPSPSARAKGRPEGRTEGCRKEGPCTAGHEEGSAPEPTREALAHPVKRDDEQLLLLGIGLWMLYSTDRFPKLRQGGVEVFELTHPGSKEHAADLPRPERVRKPSPAVSRVVANKLARLTALANAAGFKNPELAAAIAMAESGGRADSVARTAREVSVGLWQINILAHKEYTEKDLLDPENNARAAYRVSKGGQDWRPWTVYKTGAYKKYLPKKAAGE
jgi:hypothetical protein